jgi:hypothetical protein
MTEWEYLTRHVEGMILTKPWPLLVKKAGNWRECLRFHTITFPVLKITPIY